ncbi:MAG: DUF554 domain-containing protein [Bdellovibrionota bacterium]
MSGVLVNAGSIIIGTLLGLFFKKLVSDAISRRLEEALGICTLVLGLKMALQFENVLVVVACVSLGGVIGTLLKLELNVERLALKLQQKFSKARESKFGAGFTTASILYCTGAMAVVGSIQSGIMGNHEILYTKALLDGIISITFASIYGIGVAFSAFPVFFYQGAIAVLSSKLQVLSSPHVLNDISGVGGVLVAMIGLKVAGLKKIPIGDYLPAMVLVMIVAIFMAK